MRDTWCLSYVSVCVCMYGGGRGEGLYILPKMTPKTTKKQPALTMAHTYIPFHTGHPH